MAIPAPNKWNPNTTTVYSSSGSAKEIPIERYNEFIGSGWGATAPTTAPTTAPAAQNALVPPTPTPPPPPQVAVTSDQLRAEDKQNEQPYVQYAGSPDVFEQSTGKYISFEEAQTKNIWDKIFKSPDAKPEILKTPIQSIQEVFGPNWQPAPVFTPELQARGIFGAVKIGNDVYTIGPGGQYESQESFEAKFGTRDQTGIAGDINFDQAKALGITIKSETLIEPLDDVKTTLDPNYSPEENAATIEAIKRENKTKSGVDKIRNEVKEAYQSIIDIIKSRITDLAEVRKEAKEKAGLEEKSQAISDAQTAVNNLEAQYSKEIERQKSTGRGMIQITGRQSKLRSMRAVELTPLLTAIQIAQGNYDRAEDIYDDAISDWKEGKEWQLKAAQLNLDMLGENLTEAQQEARDNAEIRINFEMADYQSKLDTMEEVKKMSFIYSEAGITVGDSWEDAYRKAAPYINSEKDFEKRMNELDIKLKEKELRKPYYAPSSSTSNDDYSPVQKQNLELEFGPDWKNTTTRNEQLKFLRGGKEFAPSEFASALKNELIRTDAYGRAGNEGQVEGKVSIDTYRWMKQNWIDAKQPVGSFETFFPVREYLSNKDATRYNNN